MLLLLMSLGAKSQEQSTPPESTLRQYVVEMQFRGRQMTMICLINTDADGSLLGTMMSEMGVKVFDFTYAGGRAKILNVVGPLNRWYIRRVLRKDFTFLLSSMSQHLHSAEKGKRRFVRQPDGQINLDNLQFNIRYTFTQNQDVE